MLERFVQIKPGVVKTMVDLSKDWNISAEKFKLIVHTKEILEPVKLSVDAICRADASLITAERVITFLRQELNDVSSPLAKKGVELL